MMMFDLGRVVAVHPEDHSVDLVMARDNARLAGVQVLAHSASGDTGLSGLTAPYQADPANKWDRSKATGRDIYACVGYVDGGIPVVTGFIFPQVSQVLFARQNFRMDRHPSHVYSTINDNGDCEWFHPSGSFVRFAESTAHEDLTAQDFDKKFATSRNTTRQIHMHFELWNGGAQKASFDIDPSGNLTGTNVGTFSWHSTGNLALTTDANMTITAAGLTIAAPTNVTGASLTHKGTNVGQTHVHGGVQSGGSSTLGPS